MKDLVNLLKTTNHAVYPVVDTLPNLKADIPTYGRLRGLMTRHDIITMINKGLFCNTKKVRPESYKILRDAYPRFPTVHSIQMSEENQKKYYLDFTLSMDLAPTVVSHHKCYESLYLFVRNSGISHIVVTNHDNEVVGMVTRKDLATIETHYTRYWGPATLQRKPFAIPVTRRPIDDDDKSQIASPFGLRSRFSSFWKFGRNVDQEVPHKKLREEQNLDEDEEPTFSTVQADSSPTTSSLITVEVEVSDSADQQENCHGSKKTD